MGKSIASVVLLLTCLSAAAVRGQDVTLVQEGRPAATIVVSAQAAAELAAARRLGAEAPTKPAHAEAAPPPPLSNAAAAAQELQHYLRKISGAELPILGDDRAVEGPRVLVGRNKLTDAIAGLQIPSGRTKDLREEGFVIWCGDGRLVLAGNDDGGYRGTRFAVSELLEQIGVRWIMPGEFGEVVPRMTTIVVKAQRIEQRPTFPIRRTVDDAEWKLRLRQTSYSRDRLGVDAAGVADTSLFANDYITAEQLRDHPEWRALMRDGRRYPGVMACSANREAVMAVAQRAKQEARAGLRASGFAPDDGSPVCYCPDCHSLALPIPDMLHDPRNTDRGASTISQQWFYFANEVLKAVNREFPEHVVATNGYANRDTPPTPLDRADFNARGNMEVMFGNIYGCTLHRWDDPRCWQTQRQGEMVKRFAELSDKVWLYQYNYTMLAGKGTPTPTLSRIARNTKLMKQWGVWGLVEENVASRLANSMIERYLRAKLLWNADADPDAILDDYCQKWYGPAWPEMRAFWDALDQAIERTTQHGHEEPILPKVYDEALLAELARRLAAAESLAQTRADRAHVRIDRLIFDHLVEYVALEEAKRRADYRGAIGHIDNMLAIRERVHAVTPHLIRRPGEDRPLLPEYGDVVWERPVLDARLAKIDGRAGDLVAVLPEMARFRVDPLEDGYFQAWYAPGLDDSKWQTLSTAWGWESQGLPGMLDQRGFPYIGAAWYRLSVDVPAAAEGRSVRLHVPSFVNQALVWVNGEYAGRSGVNSAWYRPASLELDVSKHLRPGQPNQITLRVFCNETCWGANGIYERMFLYAAKPAAPQ